MKKKFEFKKFALNYNVFIIAIVLFIVCSFASESFLQPINLWNIGLQQCYPIFVAIGMLFTIIIGTIDLSVGSIMGFTASVVCLAISKGGVSLPVAILITLGIGLFWGLVNGMIVAYCNMPGFVVTLATLTIIKGIALVFTNGSTVRVEGDILLNLSKKANGYPVIIITVIVIILFILMQHYTTFGRTILAVGSNKTAVELAGIRTKRYIVAAYVISGVMSAFAGLWLCCRTSTASAVLGKGSELNAVAACVLGGASLSGGRGSVLKTVVGALCLAMIGNIMNLLGVGAYTQEIVQGVLIILAGLMYGLEENNIRARRLPRAGNQGNKT